MNTARYGGGMVAQEHKQRDYLLLDTHGQALEIEILQRYGTDQVGLRLVILMRVNI